MAERDWPAENGLGQSRALRKVVIPFARGRSEKEKMLNNVISPEERRLVILEGIGQDLTNVEIAAKMGVKIWRIKSDLRAMKYHKDSELKQAYTDKKIRAIASKQAIVNVRNEKFKSMTGMTFQEKNFENMVYYYRPELIEILGSEDEAIAIMGLPTSVQRTLARNKIINGLKFNRQISSKACDYLPSVRNMRRKRY
jgi:hypothetical protein